mmetsp:Transcript_20114/g.52500  ORF Transcript_20114/g.52500 Transcript_20114/m.52500 type:complete len:225 (-) Transcript_20114:338-1012(-)
MAAILATAPLLLLILLLLGQDDDQPNEDGDEVLKQTQCVHHVVGIAAACLLHNHLGVEDHVRHEDAQPKVEFQGERHAHPEHAHHAHHHQHRHRGGQNASEIQVGPALSDERREGEAEKHRAGGCHGVCNDHGVDVDHGVHQWPSGAALGEGNRAQHSRPACLVGFRGRRRVQPHHAKQGRQEGDGAAQVELDVGENADGGQRQRACQREVYIPQVTLHEGCQV